MHSCKYIKYQRIEHPIMDIIEYCNECNSVKPKLKQDKPYKEREKSFYRKECTDRLIKKMAQVAEDHFGDIVEVGE